VCRDVGGDKESYSLLSLNTDTTDNVTIVLRLGALRAAPGRALIGLTSAMPTASQHSPSSWRRLASLVYPVVLLVEYPVMKGT
jgi:hypothetical protein